MVPLHNFANVGFVLTLYNPGKEVKQTVQIVLCLVVLIMSIGRCSSSWSPMGTDSHQPYYLVFIKGASVVALTSKVGKLPFGSTIDLLALLWLSVSSHLKYYFAEQH